MRTIRYYSAWASVFVMFAVAMVFLLILDFEAKVSYGRYRIIEYFTYKPKGKHRRAPVTQD